MMRYIFIYMNEVRKTPKRLILNVTIEEHQKIKIAAALRNVPIRKYVLQAIVMRMDYELERGAEQ